MNLCKTKTLETKRCTLRRLTMDDAQAMFDNWACDPQVTKYLTWAPHASVQDTKKLLEIWLPEYEKDSVFRWVIFHKEFNHIVGMFDVVEMNVKDECATIGYVLAQKAWNQGIMSEVLKEVIRFLFKEVHLHRIEATFIRPNIGSGKVMEKCGLSYEGTKKQKFKTHTGTFEDLLLYGIVKEDYKRQLKEQ